MTIAVTMLETEDKKKQITVERRHDGHVKQNKDGWMWTERKPESAPTGVSRLHATSVARGWPYQKSPSPSTTD